MASYCYRPLLRPLEIRLLVLFPADSSSRIECKLLHVALDEKPNYEALSYTWGDGTFSRQILLNGHEWSVTATLETALRQLRQQKDERRLWIDALCINQIDLTEKANQIPMMHQIYLSANRVLSWTGEASADSDVAVSHILEIGKLVAERQDVWISAPNIGITGQFFQEAGINIQQMNWPAIRAFWDRPYWARAWVLQELASCGTIQSAVTDRCLIGCGSLWIEKRFADWAILFTITVLNFPGKWLEGSFTLSEPVRTLVWEKTTPKAILMFSTLLDFQQKVDESMTIDQLLRMSVHLQASDPRDKIYSLLSLFPKMHGKFHPNYFLSVEQVYMDLVKFCISDQGNLDCLLGNRPDHFESGPSWMPRFSDLIGSGQAWINDRFFSFQASGNSKPNVNFDDKDGSLTLTGIMIGVVKHVIGPFTLTGGSIQGMQDTRDVAKAIGYVDHFMNLTRFQREELPEVKSEEFWRALVLDQDYRVSGKTSPAPQEFDKMYRVLFRLDPPPQDFKPELDADARISMYAQPFSENVEKSVQFRCFVTTECGKLGWGPYYTQKEDRIVILAGGSMCFVLRPIGERYKLIGDAYIQGVMNGDYFNVSLGHGHSIESFRLC